MQKRNVLNSPRLSELKRHRRMVLVGKISLCLFAIIATISIFIYLSRLRSLNITGVEINGNKIVDTSTIKDIVENDLNGNYLWFFPKTNILLYPRNSLKSKLESSFTRIKNIDLSIDEDKRLRVTVNEREALYTWCEVSSIPDQKCHFLDEDGYIFEEAPYFSGDVYFKFYGNGSTGTFFSKENFKQLLYLKDALTKLNIKPISLHILDSGDIKIFLTSTNKLVEPYIILKTNSDFQNVIQNLEAAINTEPLFSNLKNKYSSLEYIDLRYGNKVYYMFR